jgi:hypothetical protein
MQVNNPPPIPPTSDPGGSSSFQFPQPWAALESLFTGWSTNPPSGTTLSNDIAGIMPILNLFVNEAAAGSAWGKNNPTGLAALQAALTTLAEVKDPTGTDLEAFTKVLMANTPAVMNASDAMVYNLAMKGSLVDGLIPVFYAIEETEGSSAPVGGEPGVTLTQVQMDQLTAIAAVLHVFINGGQDTDHSPIFTSSTGSTYPITLLNDLVDPNMPQSIGSYLSQVTLTHELKMSYMRNMLDLVDQTLQQLDS